MTLWDKFDNCEDEISDKQWRIYDTSNHNKLICPDYGKAYYDEYPESLDKMEVVSFHINHNCVQVYVR